jgi:DNA-binding CsgD family transcriptional regulator/tetratricopeptide (TPR) repeat protein
MRLLERDASLASIREYASEARRGDGRLVLLAGEAGGGKSALVEQLQAEFVDARWAWGACDSLFTPRPLGPLHDMAGDLGGELSELCRTNASREEIFGALLRQVSTPGTLHVLVVEDVHWADEATIDLLRFLARRVRNAPVLVIASYRDEGLSTAGPLWSAIGELSRNRSTRRVNLAPLSPRAVALLASGSGLQPDELYRLTGGNPFYVTEVVRAGVAVVPPSARDAVLTQVARFTVPARAVLDAAALIGSRVELAVLESVVPDCAAGLDELLRSGLLVGDGRWLRFRHEIARLAVEQNLHAHRACQLHEDILAAMRSLGSGDDASMAHHAEASGDAAAVLHHAVLAARRASALESHREAMAQYERALRFAAAAPPTLLAELHGEHAHEAGLADRWQMAADGWETALTLWRRVGDQLRVGDAEQNVGRCLQRLCQGEASRASVEAAVATLEPLGETPELARAYVFLAALHLLAGHSAEAFELCGKARAVAEPLQMYDVVSDAMITEGSVHGLADGDWESPMRGALAIALTHGLSTQAARAYQNLHGYLSNDRRFSEAEPVLAEAVAYCDEHDLSTNLLCLISGKAITLEMRGRWDEAADEASSLLKHPFLSPFNEISGLLVLGNIRARRGDAAAWECLDRAMSMATSAGEPQYIVPARLARAEAHWLEGAHADAVREAELAADEADVVDRWSRGAIASWLRRLGSDRVVDGQIAEPYRLQAEGHCEKAAQAWLDLGCPGEAAWALLDAGDEAPLRQALALFDGLGAAAAERVTRRRMRDIDLRSIPQGARTATREHPLGLTRRESEILNLICAGSTNAEMATRLFISQKTVDHHVSAVLRKLGVGSRSAAATKAQGLGLLGTA